MNIDTSSHAIYIYYVKIQLNIFQLQIVHIILLVYLLNDNINDNDNAIKISLISQGIILLIQNELQLKLIVDIIKTKK